MNIDVKKLGSSRIQATIVLEEDVVGRTEREVVAELGKEVRIKGFRPGMAPFEMLKEQLSPQHIQESIVQKHMPDIMQNLMEKHELKPIVRPRVLLKSLQPMTIEIILVEKPATKVNVKKIKKAWGEGKGAKKAKAAKEGDKEAKEAKEEAQEAQDENEDGLLLDCIAAHTEVDLAPELIEEEVRDLVREQARALSQYGIDLEQWLQSKSKTIEDMIKEMRPDAEKRLKIRFGISDLIDEWKVETSDEEMTTALEKLLSPISGEERSKIEELYQPGQRAYEQFKFQKTVEKVLEKLRGE